MIIMKTILIIDLSYKTNEMSDEVKENKRRKRESVKWVMINDK